MWLSEAAAGKGRGNHSGNVGVGPVTIGGENAAVLLSGEVRGLSVVAPGGVTWAPEENAQVVVLETGDGERLVLGAVADAGRAKDELTLRCGAATVRICRNGDVCVEGRLLLNGIELKPGLTLG